MPRECPVLHPLLWELSGRVEDLLRETGWAVHDPASQQGELERLSLRVSSAREEATVLLRALEGGQRASSTGPAPGGRKQFLRVQVTDLSSGSPKVNVTVPMGLVGAGLRDRLDPRMRR